MPICFCCNSVSEKFHVICFVCHQKDAKRCCNATKLKCAILLVDDQHNEYFQSLLHNNIVWHLFVNKHQNLKRHRCPIICSLFNTYFKRTFQSSLYILLIPSKLKLCYNDQNYFLNTVTVLEAVINSLQFSTTLLVLVIFFNNHGYFTPRTYQNWFLSMSQ